MSTSFWRIVNEVMKESDILLEVLDGRLVEQTRNIEIEDKARKLGKPLIYVINKCDLVEKSEMEKLKRQLHPSVFVSATQRLGTTILIHEIVKQKNILESKGTGPQTNAQKKIERMKKGKVIIGVLGYPNTGKSSLINVLAGRARTKTSPISGYTKAKQMVKLQKGVYLMDTPGVLPYKESDDLKEIIIASKDQTKLSEPDLAVMELIRKFKGIIEAYYGVKENSDTEEVLKSIAIKYNRLKRGGEPDTDVIARKILQDWQRGKIGKKHINIS